MLYKFKAGAHVPANVTAEAVHTELCAVKDRRGRLSAETLADDVEGNPSAHPLRWAFTWDEETGMRKLHLIEAGSLIRSITVARITPEHKEPVRAFVIAREDGEQRYEETAIVIRRSDLRAQLLDQIEAEFDAADKKRRELLALIRMLPEGGADNEEAAKEESAA